MIVHIKELEVFAYHGCFKEEQVLGQNYIINLKLHLQNEKASETDALEDTIDYEAVVIRVKESMKIKCRLIEHAAACIADDLLASFPLIEDIELELIKINPPIQHALKAVSVVLKKSR